MSLHDKLALTSNLFRLRCLFLCRLRSLLLDDFLRDEVASDGVRGEGWVDLNLLILSEHWLLGVLL